MFFGSTEPNFSGIPCAEQPIESVAARRHLCKLLFVSHII